MINLLNCLKEDLTVENVLGTKGVLYETGFDEIAKSLPKIINQLENHSLLDAQISLNDNIIELKVGKYNKTN